MTGLVFSSRGEGAGQVITVGNFHWGHPTYEFGCTNVFTASAYCACRRYELGLYGYFSSHQSYVFAFMLALEDGMI